MPIVSFFGDRISFPGGMSSDEISDVLGALQAGALASGEFIATLATGAAAEPVSGLVALVSGDPGAVEGIQSRLTYQPRTKAGQRAMQRIGEDIKALAESTGLDNLSGYWRDRVVPALQQQAGPIAGSVLAAAGLAAITALTEASPGGKALPKRQIGAIAAGDPKFIGFHGTDFAGEIKRFDPAFGGKNFPDEASKAGFFFSSNPEGAGTFGRNVGKFEIKKGRHKEITDEDISAFGKEFLAELEVTDPVEFEFQMQTKQFQNSAGINKGFELAIVDAKARGFDSASFIDEFGETTFVSFDPKKIKSLGLVK